MDGTWRHAQIRIYQKGFSAVLYWAQAVLLFLAYHQHFCSQEDQGHLCIVHLSILEPIVLCPSLVLRICLILELQYKEPYFKLQYGIPSVAP